MKGQTIWLATNEAGGVAVIPTAGKVRDSLDTVGLPGKRGGLLQQGRGLDNREPRKLPAQHKSARRSQPVFENAAVNAAKIGVEFQVPAVKIR